MPPPVQNPPVDPQPAAEAAVPAQDFSTYIHQVRDDEAQRRRIAEATADRRDAEMKEVHERQAADQQARRIASCDGADSQAVRQWLQQVDLSIPYSRRTVYIAAQSATGQLQVELEHFLSSQLDRTRTPWDTVKQYIQQSFLSPHEDDRLRNQLDNIKQGAFETSVAYARRFRDLVALAYPQRHNVTVQGNVPNDILERLLLRAYTGGILDENMMERVYREGKPDTYEDAVKNVTAYEADAYRVQVVKDRSKTRVEEPMEIGAVAMEQKGQSASDRKLAQIERQVGGLTTQFTKLMAALEKSHTHQPAAPREQREKGGSGGNRGRAPIYEFTEEGVPVCHYCKHEGHVRRECEARKVNASQQRKTQKGNKTAGNQ